MKNSFSSLIQYLELDISTSGSTFAPTNWPCEQRFALVSNWFSALTKPIQQKMQQMKVTIIMFLFKLFAFICLYLAFYRNCCQYWLLLISDLHYWIFRCSTQIFSATILKRSVNIAQEYPKSQPCAWCVVHTCHSKAVAVIKWKRRSRFILTIAELVRPYFSAFTRPMCSLSEARDSFHGLPSIWTIMEKKTKT